ncbi:hypothetical protein NECAME_10041 [Necator americanus]|uniref:Uncharacterized protein n=1 Tax=Necator americanus TaxID=51031 RepID=W2TBW9_NECAM|nr:hypothetical protein NECAME_10041 [Necator americanus]ETN79094.1 hypothetical protein NECAME_10041 [Necator americanus]
MILSTILIETNIGNSLAFNSEANFALGRSRHDGNAVTRNVRNGTHIFIVHYSATREWRKTTAFCDHPVRVHLIRDPERRRPPRALYIGRSKTDHTVAFIEDIELPQPSHLNTTSLMYSRVIDFPNRIHKHLDQLKTEFTVYDQSYQLLYLVNRDSLGTQHCTIYRLSNLFPGNNDRSIFMATYVYEFIPHALNKARSGWTEDPYSEEVFYVTTNGEITSIHVLPSNRLMSALQDGASGRRVFSYDAAQRNFISMSGGVLFSQYHKDDHTTIYIRPFENFNQQSFGLSCGFFGTGQKSGYGSPSVIIVRDWDYCRIRDGSSANEESCQLERDNWMIQEGLLAEPRSWWFTILIISLVILVTLLFLLVMYICWLRRSLDDTYDGDQTTNLQYYPGQYPDMDISVDRWNY